MNKTNKLDGSLKRIVRAIPEHACIAVLIFVMLVASVMAPKFFSSLNLMNILKQGSVLCVMAIGMGFVLISGCMDLTVGVNMAICAILSMILQKYIGVAGAMLAAVVAGVAISMINFLIVYVTKAKAIEIMMITFGLKMAYRGLTQAVTRNVTFREKTTDFFSALGKGSSFGGVPNIVLIMLVIAIILGIILSRMRFGRQVTCIGVNPEASRLSGISVIRTRMKCFIISGLCCGMAGILLASRTRAVNALSGDNYEMNAMCGLVIGGYSVSGGYGSVWRCVVGVFVYSIINNVLNLLGVDTFGQQLAQGIIVILAVWMDVYLRNRRAGGKM